MQNRKPIHLEGKFVTLEEIAPKYFPYVIEWRNDPELNKYLNQSFELTLDLQKKWYEEVYLQDDTQGYLIIIDKKTDTPIGTQGWTKFDFEKKIFNGGRLLLGNSAYAKQPSFFESFFVAADYTLQWADIEYIHVVKDNKKAMRLNKMMGFLPNDGEIMYPQELFVNGMEQIEMYRTKEMYLEVRKKLFERLGESLFS